MDIEIYLQLENEDTRILLLTQVYRMEYITEEYLKIIFEDGSFGIICQKNIVYLIPGKF